MIEEKYCVCDIETWVPGDKPDPEKDILRYVGFKSFNGKKIIYHSSQKDEIQKALSFFPYIVGHNFKEYDKVVLENHGFSFELDKPIYTDTLFLKKSIIIDTLEITRNRAKSMLYLDLNKGEENLKSLCQLFNLEHKKGDIDYSILKKEVLEGQEYEDLKEYLFADLDSTDDLFKHYYDIFNYFKNSMSEKNQVFMSWLKNKPGSTAYKIFCYKTGLPEDYDDSYEDNRDELYSGGYVSLPYMDKKEGNIHCIDFASLYPMMMMGAGLFNIAKDNEQYWQGSGIYASKYQNEIDGVCGKYSKDFGVVEREIYNLYLQRLEVSNQIKEEEDEEKLKDLNNRKLCIKIILNTLYGTLGSPKFKSIHSIVSASDCTALARRSIKHARTMLEDYGYECLYTDTDSVYVYDPYNDYEKLEQLANYISDIQRNSMNFPIKEHNFEIETKIKRIYFFKNLVGKNNYEYIKKHYIYITDQDKLKAKGVSIVRGNSSNLAKKVFEEYLTPKFIDGSFELFHVEELYSVVREFAYKEPELLIRRYRAKPPESYKILEGKEEASGLYYQIAKRYGEGEHYLIINKRIGAGKGNKYAPLEELKEKYGHDWIKQVRIEEYMNDLKEFIIPEERNLIPKLDRKREN